MTLLFNQTELLALKMDKLICVFVFCFLSIYIRIVPESPWTSNASMLGKHILHSCDVPGGGGGGSRHCARVKDGTFLILSPLIAAH